MALADAGAAAQGALRQMIEQRLLEQKAADDARRQAAQDTRADRELGLREAQFGYGIERDQRQEAADADKLKFEQGNILAEQMPGGTLLEPDAPEAAKLPGYLLTKREAMGPAFTGPMASGESPEQAQRGGFLKTRTQKQAEAEQDTERQGARDEEIARHNRVMEAKTGTPPKSMADTLAEYEAKKKIDAQYMGSRPSLGAERNTLNFFNRMVEAERNARRMEDKLGGRDLAAQQYAPGWLENWLQSEEGQGYTQAQRMFTEARLRKESGAAIPASEFETDRKTNFRIAGDKPELIKQKRAARLQTMRGLGNASGRALQEYFGEGVSLDDVLKEFADQQAAGGDDPRVDELLRKYGGG